MATDIYLYITRPGVQNYMATSVGSFSVRDVVSTGQMHNGQRCLDVEIQGLPPSQPLTLQRGEGQVIPVTVSWLLLEVDLRTNQIPQRKIGTVHIDAAGMVPLIQAPSDTRRWLWELLPEDVELAERARSLQPTAPVSFYIDVKGLANLVDASSTPLMLVPIHSGGTTHLSSSRLNGNACCKESGTFYRPRAPNLLPLQCKSMPRGRTVRSAYA